MLHKITNAAPILLIALLIAIGCGAPQRRMIIDTINGDRISGPLIQDLEINSSIHTDPLSFSLTQIEKISLNSPGSSQVTIETTDGNIVTGTIIGNNIKLTVAGQTISIPVNTIREINIE
jgi:hypothetical protein